MNRKVLTAAIALLMVLGTILTAAPVHAVVDPQPVLSGTSGTAGSRVTVTAPGAAAGATTYFAGHDVFVLFDREVSSADLGMQLFAFGANDRYVPFTVGGIGGFPVGVYTPGDPIYADYTTIGCTSLPCPAGFSTAYNWNRGDGTHIRLQRWDVVDVGVGALADHAGPAFLTVTVRNA